MTVWTWPAIWSADKRFYLPLLPVLAIWIARGLVRVSNLITKKNTLSLAITGIFAVYSIFLALSSSGKTWKNNIRWAKHKATPGRVSYFNSYLYIKEWTDKNQIPENTVFIVRKNRAFYHFTGFPGVKPPKSPNPGELKKIIETFDARYIVISAFFRSKYYLSAGIEALKGEYKFTRVFITPDRAAVVIKCEKSGG